MCSFDYNHLKWWFVSKQWFFKTGNDPSCDPADALMCTLAYLCYWSHLVLGYLSVLSIMAFQVESIQATDGSLLWPRTALGGYNTLP